MNVQTTIDLINTEPLVSSPLIINSTTAVNADIIERQDESNYGGDGGDSSSLGLSPAGGIRTHDILPGRGKVDHQGNVMFRKLVAERVDEYKALQNKGDRPGTLRLVRHVIEQVKLNGGRFLDKNWKNEWVEMAEKERIDKADRALRDASRNVAKRTLSSGSTGFGGSSLGSGSGRIICSNSNQQQQQPNTTTPATSDDAVSAAKNNTGNNNAENARDEGLISGIGPSTSLGRNLVPPPVVSSSRSRQQQTMTGAPLPPLATMAMVPPAAAAPQCSAPPRQTAAAAPPPQPEFDEAIFDTTESLHAALRPHPIAAASSMTTTTTTKPTAETMMPVEPLDYSCGSLFEPQAAMEFWASNNNSNNDHSYSSSSSLSVADLLLQPQMRQPPQQRLDNDEETKSAVNDNDAPSTSSPNPINATNSSSRRSSRGGGGFGGYSSIKPDSAMSLDLFAMEQSIVFGDHHHHTQQHQPFHHDQHQSPPLQQHHQQHQLQHPHSVAVPQLHQPHQQHHQSSKSLLSRSMIDLIDEDMLVDSFNQSLDFVNNHNNINLQHHSRPNKK